MDAQVGRSTRRDAEMSDTELSGTLGFMIEQAVNYWTDVYTRWRVEATNYYEGDQKILPAPPGGSRVVDRSCAEAIDTLMPSLLRVFCSVDTPVRFIPLRPEDEAVADQATDYVNWIWQTGNNGNGTGDGNGFTTFYSWFKAALMYRIGAVKIWWDKSISVREERFERLSQMQYQAIQMDPTREVLEVHQYADPDVLAQIESQIALQEIARVQAAIQAGQDPKEIQPQAAQEIDQSQLPQVYDVRLREKTERGFVNIKALPPEELLFNEYKTGPYDRQMIAHRRRVTASELREMGYSEEIIDEVPWTSSGVETRYQMEVIERHKKEYTYPNVEALPNDPSSRETWLNECYVFLDYDGDGVAEFRKITCAGESKIVVLDNEITDSHPFAIISPIPLPFKMVGMSITDQTRDLQLITSSVMRQMLDNFYSAVHSRPIVNCNVNLDDLLNPAPGSPIRVDGEPQASFWNAPFNDISGVALQVIQYLESVREARTGVTRMSAGLDPNELQDQTATAVQMMQNAGAMRMELIARVFAETGVKDAFRRILDLVVKHQDQQQVIRLRGKWVPMRPSDWRTCQFDVEAQVGLGTGNRDMESMRLQQLLPVFQQLVQLQGGPKGPLVDFKTIYNYVTKMLTTAGLKSPELYVNDPTAFMQQQAQHPQPQQPNPEMMDLQLRQQELQQAQQEFQAKHQLAATKTQADIKLKMAELASDIAMKQKELELEALKLHHGDQNRAADREVDALKLHQQAQSDRQHNLIDAAELASNHLNQHQQRELEALKLHHSTMHANADRISPPKGGS